MGLTAVSAVGLVTAAVAAPGRGSAADPAPAPAARGDRAPGEGTVPARVAPDAGGPGTAARDGAVQAAVAVVAVTSSHSSLRCVSVAVGEVVVIAAFLPCRISDYVDPNPPQSHEGSGVRVFRRSRTSGWHPAGWRCALDA